VHIEEACVDQTLPPCFLFDPASKMNDVVSCCAGAAKNDSNVRAL
jgi:hypothetical protein